VLWLHDKRFFKDYHYSGSFETSIYNLEFFIRNNNNEKLEDYLHDKYDTKETFCSLESLKVKSEDRRI